MAPGQGKSGTQVHFGAGNRVTGQIGMILSMKVERRGEEDEEGHLLGCWVVIGGVV